MRGLTLLLLIPVAFAGIAATTYTITQLTSNPFPSDGTLLEIYDPSASPKSGKYALTNLVKRIGGESLNVPNYQNYLANGVILTNFWVNNLPAGTNDVFTVPAGYHFYGGNSRLSVVTNTAAATVITYYKTNGVYYKVSSGVSVTTNTPQSWASSTTWLPEMATLAFSTSEGGVSVSFVTSYLFPTNLPIKFIGGLGLSSGLRTLYTAPAGKMLVGPLLNISQSFTASAFNASGSTATLKVYIVPPQQSASTANLVFSGTQNNDTSGSNIGQQAGSFPPGWSWVVDYSQPFSMIAAGLEVDVQ